MPRIVQESLPPGGLQLADNRRILSGALPAVLLAVAVDALLGTLERALRPRGL